MLGIKQDALAIDLGLSQQAVSALEQKEALDKDMLEKIARILKVSTDAIKSFSEETIVNVIQNNYEGSTNNNSNYNNQCTFNPLEKYIEQVEENKRLYEARLKDKEEMIATLQKLLEKQ